MYVTFLIKTSFKFLNKFDFILKRGFNWVTEVGKLFFIIYFRES